VNAKKKTPRDESTAPLFPDLPQPPPADEMLKPRTLRHPVWTEQKAKLIARYLRLFTYVTKHGTYIDGFAGRQSEQADQGWAAELVLADKPWRLRRFYLCDKDSEQVDALRALVARQPPKEKNDSKREAVEVIHGDFNVIVHQILAEKKLDPAVFCLLDQRTFECKWSTVQALAKHRRQGRKIELFYFLPIGWLVRAFVATTKNRADIEAWWGRPDWEQLVDKQHHEIAIAFKKRFEELGYKYVSPFPIFDRTQGDRVMFYMILATDHPDAPALMWRAYDQAVHDTQGWDQLELLRD
jgi:three-Cys-motif partner protein